MNINTVFLGVIAICGLVMAGFVSRETVEDIGRALVIGVLGAVALGAAIKIGLWWHRLRQRQEAEHQAWLATPKGQRQMHLLRALGRGLLGLVLLLSVLMLLVVGTIKHGFSLAGLWRAVEQDQETALVLVGMLIAAIITFFDARGHYRKAKATTVEPPR